MPYLNCIEQTLSGPNVTPRGTFIRLDVDAWLRNPYVQGTPSGSDVQIAVDQAQEPAPVDTVTPTPSPAGGRPRQIDGRTAA
jgi:hypothetical protein